MKATSTFTIDVWDANTYDEREGASLSRTRIEKTWTGDFTGSSEVEAIMARTPVETSAAYVGFERMIGTLDGRDGTFVLHHNATATGDGQSGSWTILPDSGTGQLKGITGTGEIVIAEDGTHTFTLEYELP